MTHDILFNQLLTNLRKYEGKVFKLNKVKRYNEARKKHGYGEILNFHEFCVKHDELFHRIDNKNKWKSICIINELSSIEDYTLTLARALAFPFTLTFTLALNEIDVIEDTSCDGKIVEIDGKKYKLSLVG